MLQLPPPLRRVTRVMAGNDADYYESALRGAEAAISQDPSYVKAFVRKANLEIRLGIDPIPTFRQILELDPRHARARSEVTSYDSLAKSAELLADGDELFRSVPADYAGASKLYAECVAVLSTATEALVAHKLADRQQAIRERICRASLKAAASFLELGEVSRLRQAGYHTVIRY